MKKVRLDALVMDQIRADTAGVDAAQGRFEEEGPPCLGQGVDSDRSVDLVGETWVVRAITVYGFGTACHQDVTTAEQDAHPTS